MFTIDPGIPLSEFIIYNYTNTMFFCLIFVTIGKTDQWFHYQYNVIYVYSKNKVFSIDWKQSSSFSQLFMVQSNIFSIYSGCTHLLDFQWWHKQKWIEWGPDKSYSTCPCRHSCFSPNLKTDTELNTRTSGVKRNLQFTSPSFVPSNIILWQVVKGYRFYW